MTYLTNRFSESERKAIEKRFAESERASRAMGKKYQPPSAVGKSVKAESIFEYEARVRQMQAEKEGNAYRGGCCGR